MDLSLALLTELVPWGLAAGALGGMFAEVTRYVRGQGYVTRKEFEAGMAALSATIKAGQETQRAQGEMQSVTSSHLARVQVQVDSLNTKLDEILAYLRPKDTT